MLGLDVSDKMLARARDTTPDRAVQYQRADLESVTLPDEIFDLAYSSLALHYLGKALPYRQTALASFTGYAFSHNLGLGWLSGGAVRYRLYSVWGLSSLEIGMILAFNTVTTFLGLGCIIALACLGEPAQVLDLVDIAEG